MNGRGPQHSPWGEVDHCEKIDAGAYLVSTPSHGGVMVWTPTLQVSKEAAAIGEEWGDWLCFEEDCAVSVLFLDQPHLLAGTVELNITREQCIEVASAYHLPYLEAKHITPDPTGAEQYRRWKKHEAMQSARDPDLIVSASSAGIDLTEVTTADGKEHIVTASSYKALTFPLLLLSKCIETTPGHCPICGAAMIANRRACSDRCLLAQVQA